MTLCCPTNNNLSSDSTCNCCSCHCFCIPCLHYQCKWDIFYMFSMRKGLTSILNNLMILYLMDSLQKFRWSWRVAALRETWRNASSFFTVFCSPHRFHRGEIRKKGKKELCGSVPNKYFKTVTFYVLRQMRRRFTSAWTQLNCSPMRMLVVWALARVFFCFFFSSKRERAKSKGDLIKLW